MGFFGRGEQNSRGMRLQWVLLSRKVIVGNERICITVHSWNAQQTREWFSGSGHCACSTSLPGFWAEHVSQSGTPELKALMERLLSTIGHCPGVIDRLL